MVYNPDIPQPTHLLSDSQADIQENFSQINTQYAFDHVGLTSGTNNGKHEKSTYVEQSVDPSTGAGEITVYAKNVGGDTRVFLRQQSNTTTGVQWSGPDPLRAPSGSSFLAGNLLIKWGQFQFDKNTTVTGLINFVGPDFSAKVYSLQITPLGEVTRNYSFDSDSETSFRCIRNASVGSDVEMRYMAIGPA